MRAASNLVKGTFFGADLEPGTFHHFDFEAAERASAERAERSGLTGIANTVCLQPSGGNAERRVEVSSAAQEPEQEELAS